MEQVRQTADKIWKKYRYPILILLLGLVLLLLPTRKTDAAKQPEPSQTAKEEASDLTDVQTQLAALLQRVDGAGRVQVMLTLEEQAQTVYQVDTRTETRGQDGEEASTAEQTTVCLSQGSATQVPVVSKIRAAVYRGAVVVADGGANPAVKLNLVSAVSSLTGLGADKITVIKMNAD